MVGPRAAARDVRAVERRVPGHRRRGLVLHVVARVDLLVHGQALHALGRRGVRGLGDFRHGLDSLGATELRAALEKASGNCVQLPVTLVFEAPSVRHLTTYLQGKACDPRDQVLR